MPFSAVASYSTNKGADMFVQGYEELGADFFDEFLAYSPEDNGASDYSIIPESTCLAQSIIACQSGGASSSSIDGEAKYTVAPWQGKSWAAEDENEASLHPASGDQFYELSGRAAISDSELLSLEGINLGSPRIPAFSQRSLPSSPTLGTTPTLRRKNRVVESLSKTFKRASTSIDKSLLRSPIRKGKSLPKMMGTAHHSHSSGSLDLRGQKLDLGAAKFDFDFKQNDAPLSPPLSARAPDALQLSNSAAPQEGELLNGFTYKTALTQQLHIVRPTAYDTPLSTPTLDNYPSRRRSQQLRSDSALFPITPQTQNASGSWSQMPGSPDFNTYRSYSVYPEIDSPLWWNHAATAPMAQPSPNNFQTNSQRASKTLAMQLQNDLAYDGNDLGFNPSNMANGLMIQMPDTSAQQSFVMGTSSMHPQGYFSSPHHSQPHSQHQQHQRRQASSSAHARPRHPQLSSPMIRKNQLGSSDSESPPPNPQAFHGRKRKSNKSNNLSTLRTPTTGAVDFVNYTPSDSRKILTGVAPSGSSKTKARREKEALDKRRKLSQAALRAVRAAGGDVESLVEQGLFV